MLTTAPSLTIAPARVPEPVFFTFMTPEDIEIMIRRPLRARMVGDSARIERHKKRFPGVPCAVLARARIDALADSRGLETRAIY